MTSTMKMRLTKAGKLAIYEVDDAAVDDDPFTDPLDNLARLRFHSDLLYPSIIDVQSGTANFSAVPLASRTVETINLFAHGLGATPMVLGQVELAGDVVTLAGSVPCQTQARGWGRWLKLGADATNVFLRSFSLTAYSSSIGSALSALSVPWIVYVSDFTAEGPAPGNGTDSRMVRMNYHRVTARRGEFDTDKQYIRTGSGGDQFPLCNSPTMSLVGVTSTVGDTVGWRYSVDGYIQERTFGGGGSYNATFTRVKMA